MKLPPIFYSIWWIVCDKIAWINSAFPFFIAGDPTLSYIPRIHTKSYSSTFMYGRMTKDWNFFLPQRYNLRIFEARENRHYTRIGVHTPSPTSSSVSIKWDVDQMCTYSFEHKTEIFRPSTTINLFNVHYILEILITQKPEYYKQNLEVWMYYFKHS